MEIAGNIEVISVHLTPEISLHGDRSGTRDLCNTTLRPSPVPQCKSWASFEVCFAVTHMNIVVPCSQWDMSIMGPGEAFGQLASGIAYNVSVSPCCLIGQGKED